MHGIIFTALKKYVRTRLGDEAWDNLRNAAGVGARIYLPVQAYPDLEIQALVSTASQLTGLGAQQILEDFGRFVIPDFLTVYGPLVQPFWRTLDLVEHVDRAVHPAVRANNPGSTPPDLRVTRDSPTRLTIRYESPRQLCSVGKGLIRGIADHYGEAITIVEESCMLRGEPACVMVVTETGSA